ncbi:hypothetical protein D3C76_1493630 [compost metagenome]
MIVAEEQGGDQQLKLATLARQGADDDSPGVTVTDQQQALYHPRAQKTIEEQPLAGPAERILALQQLPPQWKNNVLENHRLGVAGKNLPVDLLQPDIVKRTDRGCKLLLPLCVIRLHQIAGDDVSQYL